MGISQRDLDEAVPLQTIFIDNTGSALLVLDKRTRGTTELTLGCPTNPSVNIQFVEGVGIVMSRQSDAQPELHPELNSKRAFVMPKPSDVVIYTPRPQIQIMLGLIAMAQAGLSEQLDQFTNTFRNL